MEPSRKKKVLKTAEVTKNREKDNSLPDWYSSIPRKQPGNPALLDRGNKAKPISGLRKRGKRVNSLKKKKKQDEEKITRKSCFWGRKDFLLWGG